MLYTYVVYNTILFFVVVFSVAVQKSRNRISEYAFRTFLFLTLALPAAIRKGIGTDYWNYVGLYRLYERTSDDHEMGFQWLARAFACAGAHYQWIIVLLAVLALAPVCYYVPKKKFAYFFIIYFFLAYPHIISTGRQDISESIMVCGIIALYHKRGALKYLLCSLGAFLFHYSSVFYFPLLFFRRLRASPFWLYVLFGGVVAMTAGAGVILWIFDSPLFLDSPYGVYVGSGYSGEANVGSGLGVLANLLLPLCFVLFYPRISKYLEHSGFFALLTLLFIGSYLLATQIHIFGRLISVFLFVPAFICYAVCKAVSRKHVNLIFLCFFLVYLILFEKTICESQITLGSGLGISPYATIFD